jgi:hypothetical protein
MGVKHSLSSYGENVDWGGGGVYVDKERRKIFGPNRNEEMRGMRKLRAE